MKRVKFTNEDFRNLHVKLTHGGFLERAFVSESADWKFNFSEGRGEALLGVKNFFRTVGTDFTKKELTLLLFMLMHTNEKGECAGGKNQDKE